MIHFYNVSRFCKDDISLIENYEQAENDKTQTWDCHHRLEISLNLSRQELKERDLYYDRPASELIFMTHAEHCRLHNNLYGKKGKDCPNYGKHPTWMNNGIVSVFPQTQEEIDHYRELGYNFGRKLNKRK